MIAYYNEIDSYAAQWLCNLIDAGEIAPGTVDVRDIWDVTPTDLDGHDRCHFFAGIAGWDYALKLAGWPEDLPVWTGSCPCQPFSAAGKRGKGSDERHLWPAWFHLIRVCRPPIIFGEQVASNDGLKWLDLVCSDLEAEGYAVGAADLCAASVGAPHIRQRLWFVGYSKGGLRRISKVQREDLFEFGRASSVSKLGHTQECGSGAGLRHTGQAGIGRVQPSDPSPTGLVADALGPRLGGGDKRGLGAGGRKMGEQENGAGLADQSRDGCQDAGELADSDSTSRQQESRSAFGDEETNGREGRDRSQQDCYNGLTGYGENPWSTLFWLPCRDGKFRPTKPGLLPLAHGVSGRMGRLRAYGNAIVPQVAAKFIGAVMEFLDA